MNTYEQLSADGIFPITFFNYCPMGSPGGVPAAVADWVDAGMTVGRTPGFNADTDDPADVTAILDACGEAGIKAIVVDARCSYGRHVSMGDKGVREGMAAALKDFGSHPAVFGFDVGDEPANRGIISCYRTTAIHRELAPHLTPFANLGPYRPGTAEWMGRRSFRGFLDDYCRLGNPPFLCFDVYWQMIRTEGALNQYFACLKMYADAARRAGVPWWVTLLAVGHYTYNCPTEDDFRWQVNTAAAHGAKGLAWFFLYMREPHGNYRVPPIDEHWERTETFAWMSRVLRTFQKMHGPTLTKLNHHQVWHVGRAYGGYSSRIDSEFVQGVRAPFDVIVSEFFDAAGRPYVAIVNNTFTESGQAVITWHGKPKVYRVGWESKENLHRNYIDDDNPANTAAMTGPWLAPGQMELYRLDYSQDDLPVGYRLSDAAAKGS